MEHKKEKFKVEKVSFWNRLSVRAILIVVLILIAAFLDELEEIKLILET